MNNKFPLKIVVYTFCFNEESIIPFCIDYWKLFASKVIVYDNFSTDRSVEILSKEDFVEVRKWDTGGKLDDYAHTIMKNSVFKESVDDADFICVCDMDECIFSDRLFERLGVCNGAIRPKFLNLISNIFPKYNGKLMHNIVDRYTIDMWDNDDSRGVGRNPTRGEKRKLLLFNPKVVQPVYGIGAYVTQNIPDETVYDVDDVYCFHLSEIGLTRKMRKFKSFGDRLDDKSFLLGQNDSIKYHFYVENKKDIIDDFMNELQKSKKLELKK